MRFRYVSRMRSLPARPGYSLVTCMARMFSRILSSISDDWFGSGGWQTSVASSAAASSPAVAGASGSTTSMLGAGVASGSTWVEPASSWRTRA